MFLYSYMRFAEAEKATPEVEVVQRAIVRSESQTYRSAFARLDGRTKKSPTSTSRASASFASVRTVGDFLAVSMSDR